VAVHAGDVAGHRRGRGCQPEDALPMGRIPHPEEGPKDVVPLAARPEESRGYNRGLDG
jgi:hypothetical protein